MYVKFRFQNNTDKILTHTCPSILFCSALPMMSAFELKYKMHVIILYAKNNCLWCRKWALNLIQRVLGETHGQACNVKFFGQPEKYTVCWTNITRQKIKIKITVSRLRHHSLVWFYGLQNEAQQPTALYVLTLTALNALTIIWAEAKPSDPQIAMFLWLWLVWPLFSPTRILRCVRHHTLYTANPPKSNKAGSPSKSNKAG
jgi:hypothetical protein